MVLTTRTSELRAKPIWSAKCFEHVPTNNTSCVVRGWVAVCTCLYIEEIIALSRSSAEHVHHVKHLIPLLCNAEATLKFKKKKFFFKNIWLPWSRCKHWARRDCVTHERFHERNQARRECFLFKRFFRPLYYLQQLAPNVARATALLNDKSTGSLDLEQKWISPQVLVVPYDHERLTLDIDAWNSQGRKIFLQKQPHWTTDSNA